jgi:AraC family transcriptional regulator
MRRLSGTFYGATLKCRDFSGFTCSENIYPSNLRIASHGHERAYFSLVLSGSYNERHGVKTHECRRLSARFHPPGEEHSDCFCDAGGRIFSVEFKSDLLKRLRDSGIRLLHPAGFAVGPSVHVAFRLYRDFQNDDIASQLSLEGITLELLAEIFRLEFRGSMPPPSWLKSAEEILRSSFSSPPGHWKLASSVGVHPVHLAREFRRHFRCSVGDYIRRLRIDFVRRSLLETDAPLSEVALSAGFSDQSHLTRVFREAMGVPPGQFRKTLPPQTDSIPLSAFKTSRTRS